MSVSLVLLVLIALAVAVLLSGAVGAVVWWVARDHPAAADGLTATIATFIAILGLLLAVLLAAGLVRAEDPAGVPGSPPPTGPSVQRQDDRVPRSGECRPRHGDEAPWMQPGRVVRS